MNSDIPQTVELREEPMPAPAAGQLLIQTLYSAISAGTEMLLYRGEAPTDMATDDTIAALSGTLKFLLNMATPPWGASWPWATRWMRLSGTGA